MRPDSVKAIYLQFPLPGPKAQGFKPRVFDKSFVSEVHRVLEPGGRLSVITDREPAFLGMLSLVEQSGGFRQARESEESVRIEGELRSHNFSVWTGRGFLPFRFEAIKLGKSGTGRLDPSGGIHGSIGS
jgi:tRNA G46 methylase TrmB